MGAWLAEAQGRCRRARSRRALPQQSGTIGVFAREGAALCSPRHYCVVLSKIDEDITGSLDVIPRRWFCNRAHGNRIAARSAAVSHQFGGWVRRSQVRYPSARRRLQTSWARRGGEGGTKQADSYKTMTAR